MIMNEPRKYYYLDIDMHHCSVIGEVNGFPCYKYNAKFPGNYAYPINAFLTRNNKIKLYIFRIEGDESTADEFKEKVTLEGSVKLHYEGGVSAPETGDIIAQFDKSAITSESFPMVLELNFNNEDYDFSKTMYQIKQLTDENEIRNYALHLYDLLINKDYASFMNELEYKISEYQEAFYDSITEIQNETNDFLRTLAGSLKIPENIDASIFELTPVCDGRIMKIDLKGKDYLFETEPDDDDAFYFLRIYVGKVDGELKVIR